MPEDTHQITLGDPDWFLSKDFWETSFDDDAELLALAGAPKNPRPKDIEAWAKRISNDWHRVDQDSS